MLCSTKTMFGIDYTIIMRHCMPPPPSPHNKSYDNIDIGSLVVWLTNTCTLIVIISINNTTYQTMFAIIYTSTCTPPPTLLKRNAIIATIVYLCSFNWPCISSHILRKIFVLFLFKVYVISSQSVRSDYLLV